MEIRWMHAQTGRQTCRQTQTDGAMLAVSMMTTVGWIATGTSYMVNTCWDDIISLSQYNMASAIMVLTCICFSVEHGINKDCTDLHQFPYRTWH